MNSTEHNAKVRALADRMPADMLARAVRAIGYRANFATGITSGFSVATMAKLSSKHLGGAYLISARHLKRAITILEAAEVIRVTHAPAIAGKWQPNTYQLDYEHTDEARVAKAYEAARAQWQRPSSPAKATEAPASQHDVWACAQTYYRNFTCPICLTLPSLRRMPSYAPARAERPGSQARQALGSARTHGRAPAGVPACEPTGQAG